MRIQCVWISSAVCSYTITELVSSASQCLKCGTIIIFLFVFEKNFQLFFPKHHEMAGIVYVLAIHLNGISTDAHAANTAVTIINWLQITDFSSCFARLLVKRSIFRMSANLSPAVFCNLCSRPSRAYINNRMQSLSSALEMGKKLSWIPRVRKVKGLWSQTRDSRAFLLSLTFPHNSTLLCYVYNNDFGFILLLFLFLHLCWRWEIVFGFILFHLCFSTQKSDHWSSEMQRRKT